MSILHSRIHTLLVIVALILSLGFSAHVGAGQTVALEEQNAGLRVTISVFSGRPDPSFLITNQQVISELKALLDKSPVNEGVTEQQVMPAILGYRGLLIENQGNLPGFPRRIEIFDGRVGLSNGPSRCLLDPGRKIERHIMELSRQAGSLDERLLRHIQDLEPNL